MTAPTILTIATCLLLLLTACGKDFDDGGGMRADVVRAQHDRCEIIITPMWSDRAFTARLNGCKP